MGSAPDWMLSGSKGSSWEFLRHSHLESRRSEAFLQWRLVEKQQLLILVRKRGYLGIVVVNTMVSFPRVLIMNIFL